MTCPECKELSDACHEQGARRAEWERRAWTLQDALEDLAEAARNACDARQHTPLINALAKADYVLAREKEDSE